MTNVKHFCTYCRTQLADNGGVFIDPRSLQDAAERGVTHAFSDVTGWPLNMWITVCDECDNRDGRVPSTAYYIPLASIRTTSDIGEWQTHLQPKSWFHLTKWDEYVARFFPR